MKSFKLTPLVAFLILLIVLAISIYMRNSYFVEGVENMFNDKGQFSEFILPEYSQTSPLTQLTETIFYDKKNGNIVEAVVEWNTQTQNGTEGEHSINGADAEADAEMVGNIGENIANTIKTIANESSNSSEEEIKEKVRTKIDETIPFLGNLSNGLNNKVEQTKNDITENKDTIVNEIASKIKKEGPNLPENVVDSIPSIKNALNNANDVVGENLSEGHENMGSLTSTLKKLIITPRGGAESYIYDFSEPVSDLLPTQESLIGTIDNTCVTWSYVSQSEFAPETTVFYVPWKNDTYVSIYEKSDDNKITPRGVFHFSKEKQGVANVNPIEITNSSNTQDDDNNKYVKDEKYGEHDLYQVDKFVLYDIPTSNLIVRKEHNTGSITIYNGAGEIVETNAVKKMYDDNKTHENQEKYAELKAWTALDGQGENIITYIKNVDKTLVFVCGFESSAMDSLVLKNVRRFTLYGMDNCEKVEKPTPSASCDKKETKEESKEESKSDDYILKTQIVPPVCPTCPMCPKDVTCTNCGGNGGSGTKASNGKSIVGGNASNGKSVLGDTVDEVTDLARDATSGAVDLGRDATSGAVGLGREIIGGALGLGREIIGGATGLVQDVTGGATGLIRDAGSGVAGILTPAQQRQQQQQIGNSNGRMAYQQTGGNGGQYYGTNNNYTRYGALPERPSNFIPRTADFSSFA